MDRRTGAIALLLLALAMAAPVRAQQADTARMATGRRYVQWLYAGRTDTLFALLGPQMRRAVPSAEQLAAGNTAREAQIGTETEVLEERIVPGAPEVTVYVRSARFSKSPTTVDITVVTDAAGTIHGLGIRPRPSLAASRFLDYRTKAEMRLPFEGEWLVFWGGRELAQNYHAATVDQRFAYDLVVRQGESTHTGDGTSVEQYYCWGRAILAPAAGTVVTARDSLPDNRPGVMDRQNAAGNYVMLDHGGGEFSLLAHLRRGSVAVRAGDRVAPGQKLGECGNSGNTSEPHLHFHMQNGPVFGQGEGLPVQFVDYAANGQPVARGEPVRGQTIAPN